ncbi:MAG: hypothetical protein HRT57_13230 [Crocinitomicaceae bacterium]|nr:hypothetical protein [Crocinitomicaceae bacterium]
MKLIILALFCVFGSMTFAQNDLPNREAFSLVLPVDSINYYRQEIEATPYFVATNVLQIYPGESIFVEVETFTSGIIKSMKVVKENLKPQTTIELNFSQTVADKKSQSMMLKVVNPFGMELTYSAQMFVIDNDKLINTTTLPVMANLTSFETWPDVIVTLILSQWKLKI